MGAVQAVCLVSPGNSQICKSSAVRSATKQRGHAWPLIQGLVLAHSSTKRPQTLGDSPERLLPSQPFAQFGPSFPTPATQVHVQGSPEHPGKPSIHILIQFYSFINRGSESLINPHKATQQMGGGTQWEGSSQHRASTTKQHGTQVAFIA